MDISTLQQMIQLQALSQLSSSSTDSSTSASTSSTDQFSSLLSNALAGQSTANSTTSSTANYAQSLGLINGLTNNTDSLNALTSSTNASTADASKLLMALGSSVLAALTANGLTASSTSSNGTTSALANLGSTLSASNVANIYDNYRNTYANNATETDTIAPVTSSASEKRTDYDAIIKKASETYGIPTKMIKAVIQQESGFNATATSGVGAQGLMQLMPATAKSLGVTDSTDAEQNIMAGTKYLKQMLNQFGDYKTMLAAYNAGPGNVSKYNGIPPFTETQNYVSKVMANYNA